MEIVWKLLRFAGRVLRRFYYSNGLLFASAVAYNALLSIVPLIGLTLTGVSAFVPEEELLRLITTELRIVLPGSASALASVFYTFVEERALAGGVSFIVLLVFSSIAFRALDEALGSMFVAPEHSPRPRRRYSGVLIPLTYIGLFATGLTLATMISIGLEMLPEDGLTLFGYKLGITISSRGLFELLTFVALVALLASFYRVMPKVHVRMRYCVAGGLVAAVLWDVVRRGLVYYFDNVSLVGVIYGSLATVVVLLLSLEAFALVVLLGGQVIAEVDRSQRAGLPWFDEPLASTLPPPPSADTVGRREAVRGARAVVEEPDAPVSEGEPLGGEARQATVPPTDDDPVATADDEGAPYDEVPRSTGSAVEVALSRDP